MTPSYREGNDLNFTLRVSRNGESFDLSEASGLEVTVRHISRPAATLPVDGVRAEGNSVRFRIQGSDTVGRPPGRYVVVLRFSTPSDDGGYTRDFAADAPLFDLVRHSWGQ